MKIINTLLPISLLHAVAFSSASFAASEIEFHIEGVKQGEGKLMIQLFKGEDSYNAGEALVATAVSAKADSAVIKFTDIEAGEYALRFFHDENNNGQMETNFFGMPSEGYGFSNNAKPNFGPVPYSEMAFTITVQDAVVINKTHVIY